MSIPSIGTAAGPALRMIFWGVLICVIDISWGGFDLLHDFFGSLLVCWGVAKLAAISVGGQYRSGMVFVLACAVLNCVESFIGVFKIESQILSWFSLLLGLATLIAIIVFCTSMYRLASVNELNRSASSWLTTRLLAIIFWVIPLGLFQLVATGWLVVNGQPISIDLGLPGLLLFVLLLVPLIHFLVSTSRLLGELSQPIMTLRGVLLSVGAVAIIPIVCGYYLISAALTPPTRLQLEKRAFDGVSQRFYTAHQKSELARLKQELRDSKGLESKATSESKGRPIEEIISNLGETMLEFDGEKIAWDTITPSEFKPGDINKTIVMFPDLNFSDIERPTTPLLVHVFSTQEDPEKVGVYLVFAKARGVHLMVDKQDFENLLTCQTPAEAADWYASFEGIVVEENIYDFL